MGAAATLTYMPTEHVPVLASELIALTGPRPGEVAVDCTFGGGGHARLVAERLAPGGELICIDRDPTAEERFAEFAARGPVRDALRSRRLRRRPRGARGGGGPRGPRLHGPRDLVAPARRMGARLLLLLRRPARHADGPRPGALGARGRQRMARAPHRRRDPRLRRGAPRAPRRARDRQPPPAADHLAARRGDPRGAAARRRASGAAIPPSARSRESGSPSTASSRRSTSRCPPRGSSCAPAGASPRSPSTRSRTGASSASSPRARPGAPAPRDPGLPSAAGPPRRSCSAGAPSHRRPRRRGQSALAVGPPARAVKLEDGGG